MNFCDSVLEHPCDKRQDSIIPILESQDKQGVEAEDAQSTSPTQPNDSNDTSSKGDGHCQLKITNWPSEEQLPLSPDCEPHQSLHRKQKKSSAESVNVTTTNERISKSTSSHSRRHRQRRANDALNSQQQQSLIKNTEEDNAPELPVKTNRMEMQKLCNKSIHSSDV
jgi:hypothetical protein